MPDARTPNERGNDPSTECEARPTVAKRVMGDVRRRICDKADRDDGREVILRNNLCIPQRGCRRIGFGLHHML